MRRAAGQNGACSGYFYAIGDHPACFLERGKINPHFRQKLNNGDLVSLNENKITLKKGHTYSVSLSGTIGISPNNDCGGCYAVLTDGYDNEACKNATRIYRDYNDNKKHECMLYQVPFVYNRIYNAKDNDIELTYNLEQEKYNTYLDSFNFTYTLIALD